MNRAIQETLTLMWFVLWGAYGIQCLMIWTLDKTWARETAKLKFFASAAVITFSALLLICE